MDIAKSIRLRVTPAAAHDFGSENKQWHCHEGKDVKLGKNTLWQDREKLCFVDSHKGQNGHRPHQIGKGRAADQEHE